MTYVTSVTVSPKNVKIKPGEWYENLNATVLPANADKPCIAWTSSNENVVSVSSSSGAVYGIGLGTAVVYATSIDGTNITDCCTFTVTNDIPITNLALDKTALSMQLNENRTLSATFLPANATNKALTWCSDNTNVVTVNNGTLSPVSTGNAVVTAYTNDGSNLSASCTVKVTTDILVRCITVSDETLSLAVGKSKYITAEVCPTDATNTCVVWTSANPDIATVNPTSGLISALSDGHTTITATAADGSGVIGSCQLTVFTHVPIERISIASTKAVDAGDTFIIPVTICPLNATDNEIIWSSNNTEVVQIDSSTGEICARTAGIANITAKSKNNPSISATCELWIRGKKAVFLLHGRESNSAIVWGATNSLFYDAELELENTGYDSGIAASTNNKVYIDPFVQNITSHTFNATVNGQNVDNYVLNGIFDGKIEKNILTSPHPEGGNLAFHLTQNGYFPNINLFVFNYPNSDAVIHNAKKFKIYIEQLTQHIIAAGTDAMKTCFYTSRQAYDNNYYSFNLVGHSMGGLVCRYYIENLGEDGRVDKLITINTPHWGANFISDASHWLGTNLHKLCDHDLTSDSALFGGNNDATLTNGCPSFFNSTNCAKTKYTISPELNYTSERVTRYYFIAGIDFNATSENDDNFGFELPTDFTTIEEIQEYFDEFGLSELVIQNGHGVENVEEVPLNILHVGDNLVSFLSQIGCKLNNNASQIQKIALSKCYVLIDTNGGNGYITINDLNLNFLDLLHNKVPHRVSIMNKVLSYLNE